MTEPPESETPGPGATEPGVEGEITVGANSESEDSNSIAAAPAESSNVIPFRPVARGKPHPYEVVEIVAFSLMWPKELWVAVAGPWSAPPGSSEGGRKPWHKIAVFPHAEADAAVGRARQLAAELGVPIVDLAGVMDDLLPPDGGPEAA